MRNKTHVGIHCKLITYNYISMLKIKHLLLATVPAALMGCGSSAMMSGPQASVVMSHDEAAGHRLLLMKPAPGTQLRLVSCKQHDYSGAPSIDDPTILLNIAAAFTLDTESMDVCGDHVVAGRRIKGYDDVTATGHMLIVGNNVSISPNSHLNESINEATSTGGYLFQQCLIVEDGKGKVERIPQALRERNPHIIFRAACIMTDGSLAIVQGDEPMYCDEFINSLVALGARQALYLDMGTWAWGWVREAGKPTQELAERFFNTRYQSNWLQVVAPPARQ